MWSFLYINITFTNIVIIVIIVIIIMQVTAKDMYKHNIHNLANHVTSLPFM